MMKRPKALKYGDTVGLVAPSSPVSSADKVDLSVQKLMELGFKVKVGKSCLSKYGYLSGQDDVRAEDLNSMFADKSIDGIICIKGGYGTPRILDQLDYSMIEKNPKLFAGYSDITALHIAFNQICKLVTFHGPMPASDMLSDFGEFSKNSFTKAITEKEVLGELRNPVGVDVKTLIKGKATGHIVGGNLSLITATIGSKYEIDTKGKILFIEDIDEQPYRIDRMLTQLRLAGKLEDCTGIIIGDWNNCVPSGSNASLTLEEIIKDIIVPAGKPTIFNFKAGHCEPKITIPMGVEAALDADNGSLFIKECAVL